jgi:hypothetical protein
MYRDLDERAEAVETGKKNKIKKARSKEQGIKVGVKGGGGGGGRRTTD